MKPDEGGDEYEGAGEMLGDGERLAEELREGDGMNILCCRFRQYSL